MTTEAADPWYVRGSRGGTLVTLTHELPMRPWERYPHFIGDHDGQPIRYHCLDVGWAVAIRYGLAEGLEVVHNAPGSWLDFATPDEVAMRGAIPGSMVEDLAALNDLAHDALDDA